MEVAVLQAFAQSSILFYGTDPSNVSSMISPPGVPAPVLLGLAAKKHQPAPVRVLKDLWSNLSLWSKPPCPGEAAGEPGGGKALVVIGQARGSGGSAFAAAARHRAAKCGSRNKPLG